MFLSDSAPFAIYIGVSPFLPYGRSPGYGLCIASPIHMATLSYFCQGLTGPCCLQTVVPHGETGAISAVDCAGNLIPATGGTGIWNSDPSCSCDVAARSSTWGQVKSMYQ